MLDNYCRLQLAVSNLELPSGFVFYQCDTVKLASPLFTIYTFDFIVNNSSLYLPKLLIIVLQTIHTF